MPGLAEFLKGTVSEPLTKLVQPAGVVPATVLVLWNLGFVMPRAKEQELGFAESFYELKDAWQVTVVTVLIFVVGYLLLNASGAVLDTLSGRTWRTSLLGSGLSRLRGWRRAWLAERLDQIELGGRDIERPESLRWRLRTRYAYEDDLPAPTGLGDVLLASDHGIRARYGLSVAALWEPLKAVVKADDPAIAAAAESKTTVDVMGNLTFAALLILFEGVVVFTMFKDPDAVLLSLFAAPVAYVTYRVTVARTISWCDAIDTVVALHAPDLFEQLGVEKPADGLARRENLSRLSDFMLRNEADDDLFGAKAAPKPTVDPWPNVKVEVTEREERSPAGGPAGAVQRSSIWFRASVTRTVPEDEPLVAAGRFLFADARLPRIRAKPTGTTLIAAGEPDQGDALLCSVEVKGAGVEPLEFTLDRWRVAVNAGCNVTVREFLESARFVEVRNPNGSAVTPTVTVFHTEDGATHEIASAQVNLVMRDDRRTRTGTLPSIPPGRSFRFVYTLEERSE